MRPVQVVLRFYRALYLIAGVVLVLYAMIGVLIGFTFMSMDVSSPSLIQDITTMHNNLAMWPVNILFGFPAFMVVAALAIIFVIGLILSEARKLLPRKVLS